MVESDTSSRPTALQQNCLCFITTQHRRGSELAAKQSRTPLFKTAALRQSRGPFDSWASVCLNLARSRPGRRRGPCWKPPCPPRAARDPAAERRASAQREMRVLSAYFSIKSPRRPGWQRPTKCARLHVRKSNTPCMRARCDATSCFKFGRRTCQACLPLQMW